MARRPGTRRSRRDRRVSGPAVRPGRRPGGPPVLAVPAARRPGGPGGPAVPAARLAPAGPAARGVRSADGKRKGSWWRHWTWKKALAVTGGLVLILVLGLFGVYEYLAC